jgi:tRNA threonylcarbamoyladenosine biosynthesis protein TsaB
MLAEQGWKPRDLTGVIVSQGPGSYTGLRVGIMSAKALAYATGCALIGVETLAAVAAQAPAAVALLDVIADAQQDNVYVQRYERFSECAFRAVTCLAIVGWTELLSKCETGVWFSGPGLHRRRDQVSANSLVIESNCWEPRAESLFRLGREQFLRGERDDPWTLEPLYLRPSSAEEQWARRTGALAHGKDGTGGLPHKPVV